MMGLFSPLPRTILSQLQVASGTACFFLVYGYVMRSSYLRVTALGILGIILIFTGIVMQSKGGAGGAVGSKPLPAPSMVYPLSLCIIFAFATYHHFYIAGEVEEKNIMENAYRVRLEKRVLALEEQILQRKGVGEKLPTEIVGSHSEENVDIGATVTAPKSSPLSSSSSSSLREGPSTHSINKHSCDIHEGRDYTGNDLFNDGIYFESYDECCQKCAVTPHCKGFTFTISSKQCWLKHSIGSTKNNPSVVSGKLL
mmetsp:Transcript_17520/g.24459  ORF Transcript_17520/g.24459 Transcript_17520/m.24459 type:complete len:255 (+) Transcript_17520:102-866(+)